MTESPKTNGRARVRSFVPVLCAIGVVFAGPLAGQELPTADEVIGKYVEAIGGREAHTSPVSIRSLGTISMPSMGLQGEFEVLQIAPNRMLTRVQLPGVGEILSGFDGATGWSTNPLVGAMVMQGSELAEARERADMRAALRDPAVVLERETLELGEIDGEPCWRVRLGWLSGRESIDCYSQATGLLLASEDSQTSAMGEISVTTRFSNYLEFEGMVVPTTLIQTSMGQTQEMSVQEVRIGDVSAAELEPPASIRTLLGGLGDR